VKKRKRLTEEILEIMAVRYSPADAKLIYRLLCAKGGWDDLTLEKVVRAINRLCKTGRLIEVVPPKYLTKRT